MLDRITKELRYARVEPLDAPDRMLDVRGPVCSATDGQLHESAELRHGRSANQHAVALPVVTGVVFPAEARTQLYRPAWIIVEELIRAHRRHRIPRLTNGRRLRRVSNLLSP